MLLFKAKFIAILLSSLLTAAVTAKPLMIASPLHGPPKYYVENDRATGFVVDITQWVLNDMQVPYQMNPLPWKRAYANALQAKMAIIGLSKNSNRLKIFDYSAPLYFGDLVFIVKKGREFPFESIADLKNKVISTGPGVSYGDRYDDAVTNRVFKVIPYETPVQGLKLVLRDRVDAILIGPGINGLRTLVNSDDALRMEQFSILEKPFKRDAKHLGFHKSMFKKEFLDKFNQSLRRAWDTGVVDRIVESYYQ
ncbi:MAG: transporter substrate-binding domain-containing protein [Oceanospirillaceae bacterium]|nr:transporter substrate-binding domain-containing protein [Oceanospirillaceae bacterium]